VQIVNLQSFAESGARLGRGKVSGLSPLVGTSGSLLGSLAGGALGQTLGLQRVFLLYAACFCALLLLVKYEERAPVALAVPEAE
jgi:MFS family permease